MSAGRRRLIIIGTLAVVVGGLCCWFVRQMHTDNGMPSQRSGLTGKSPRPHDPIVIARAQSVTGASATSPVDGGTKPIGLKSAPRAKEDPKTNTALVAFPFLGEINTTYKTEIVSWTDSNGQKFRFSFKFYYADNGVWVRAEYRGHGPDYYEWPLDDLQGLHQQIGESIVGLPSKQPSVPFPELLKRADGNMPLEKASKIVLEHVLLRVEPSPPNPKLLTVVMVKVWGVSKLSGDSPDTIPRTRIVNVMDSKYQGWMDDTL